jgi:peptidoglycan/LPS O-acetylase OafA/YrhL
MKIYFKNLDGIRFIAALLVILHHAQFFKTHHQVGVLTFLDGAFLSTGRIGVNLFFVLSGFLISYLLMSENAQTGTINFRNFYFRRILRIWPLYLAYGIGLTLLSPFLLNLIGVSTPFDPHTIWTNLLFLVLFAVNIQLAFFPYNQGIVEITWSVCIEEQFYLLWPLLLLLFRKRLKSLFIVLICIGFTSKLLCLILPHFYNVSATYLLETSYLLLFDKLELFGTGMFAAYILFHRERYLGFLSKGFTKPVQWMMLIITAGVIFSVLKIPVVSKYYFDHFFHAALFGYLMLAAVSENSILNLEYPIMKTLGKISYGIYMFHTPICQAMILVFIKIFGPGKSLIIYDILYPLACVVITCLIAWCSYEWYEKRFLKIKSKYAVVQTRI